MTMTKMCFPFFKIVFKKKTSSENHFPLSRWSSSCKLCLLHACTVSSQHTQLCQDQSANPTQPLPLWAIQIKNFTAKSEECSLNNKKRSLHIHWSLGSISVLGFYLIWLLLSFPKGHNFNKYLIHRPQQQHKMCVTGCFLYQKHSGSYPRIKGILSCFVKGV